MLLELEIQDFAIVEAARVEFAEGLCVLTGETGAGKSILIDAIGALVGERTTAEMVRSGADIARLRAAFDVDGLPGIGDTLAELAIEPDPDGLLILTREIRAGGRSRCTINGSTANVAALRQLGERLIDIHGQHEHQSLMRVSEHRRILDSTGGEALAAARARYREVYDRWRAVLDETRSLQVDEGEKARRADLLRYQLDEITTARLKPGEDEELRAQRGRLAHAERLAQCASLAYESLQESAAGDAATDRLGAALEAVEEIAAIDADLAPLVEELSSALAVVEEAARTLGRYADSVEADPAALDALEQRLDLIDRLRRKYGDTIEAVLAFGERTAAELAGIEGSEERLLELARERKRVEVELAKAGQALSALRSEAATAMRGGIEGHLRDLNMTAARFDVALGRRPDDNGIAVDGQCVAALPDGLDEVEFLFSANPGEPPRPLARIASGGEISRVMLALKSELAAGDMVPTMVFDEIDVGIGGVTIASVGRKMAALARNRQILVITHHAPIAALADAQIAISKSPEDEATRVTVQRLEGDDRIFELARMLGRQPPTEATLAMARELMQEAGKAV